MLVGMQNGTAISEDACKFLTKVGIFLPYDSTITLWYDLLTGTENFCPYKNLHTGVHRCFTDNCLNLEATKSFSNWMDWINLGTSK